MSATMTQRRGVTLPIDTDCMNPDSILAAVTMAVSTLEARSAVAREPLDWGTVEIAFTKAAAEGETSLIVRAAML